jgi:hypothetical protein
MRSLGQNPTEVTYLKQKYIILFYFYAKKKGPFTRHDQRI